METNLSPNLALKLSLNENYFTEKLMGISSTEFKLFISNWKGFDLYFPLLKTRIRTHFLWMETNLRLDMALKLAPDKNYFTEELIGISLTEFRLFISNWKIFDLYFPLLETRKCSCFLRMETNLSPNLALKLSLNENYFTERLMGISLTEFKLFISNWKGFDLYFPLLKTRIRTHFLWMETNLRLDMALKLAPDKNYFTEELIGISLTEFRLFISNWKIFDLYFPLLETRIRTSFLWMETNLRLNLALKLSLNENYFTEKLMGISLTEFKLFISNWRRFDLYFPC